MVMRATWGMSKADENKLMAPSSWHAYWPMKKGNEEENEN